MGIKQPRKTTSQYRREHEGHGAEAHAVDTLSHLWSIDQVGVEGCSELDKVVRNYINGHRLCGMHKVAHAFCVEQLLRCPNQQQQNEAETNKLKPDSISCKRDDERQAFSGSRDCWNA